VELSRVVSYLDDELRTADIADYPGALNGLQLANSGRVNHIGAAVDFSTASVNAAVDLGVDLLVVHHGMFWGGAAPLTGMNYERVRLLLQQDIAVYASHLPLDVHPRLGNNALLARQLDLVPSGGFARHGSLDVGLRGDTDVPTSVLFASVDRLAHEHGGRAVCSPFDPARRTLRWALCTGSGASSDTVREASQLNIDTLIVGEGPHHTAVTARDMGLVLIYGGHYATETLGVAALTEELAARFGVARSFIDAPTGL
jgi:dinuclear metal center YbgI/SA1388 family protein